MRNFSRVGRRSSNTRAHWRAIFPQKIRTVRDAAFGFLDNFPNGWTWEKRGFEWERSASGSGGPHLAIRKLNRLDDHPLAILAAQIFIAGLRVDYARRNTSRLADQVYRLAGAQIYRSSEDMSSDRRAGCLIY